MMFKARWLRCSKYNIENVKCDCGAYVLDGYAFSQEENGFISQVKICAVSIVIWWTRLLQCVKSLYAINGY